MTWTTKILAAAIGAAFVGGCYVGAGAGADGSGNGSGNGSTDAGGCSADPFSSVQALVASQCLGCHTGASPSSGIALVTPADFKAATTNAKYAGMDRAHSSVARMKDGSMPPQGGASGNAGVIQAWIDANYPDPNPGACAVDAGGSGPFSQPPGCLSGKQGPTDNAPNSQMPMMYPGRACIDCHKQNQPDAPLFSFAGTVYKNGHETDQCASLNLTTLTVSLVDKNGKSFSAKVNSGGNFMYEPNTPANAPVPPFSKVTVTDSNGNTNKMSEDAPHGDCNVCHTQNGASGAPGRIVAPY